MRKILGIVGVSLAAASASAAPQLFNGHYYDIIRAPAIPWIDAHDAAFASSYSGLQGHLVTITSPEEHDFVNGVIQQMGLGEMWAGGYQSPASETNPQANWNWVNGEGSFPGVDSTTPYAKWNGGEPNDFYGPGSEQYLGLNFGPGFNDEGALGNISGYVIEYDPNTVNDNIPDGGSSILMLAGAFAGLAGLRSRARK